MNELITFLCICMLSVFSGVWFFLTPQIVALQPPLSLGFPRQEYWSGLPFPPPGDLPDPGIKLTSLASTALAGGFFTTIATCEAHAYACIYINSQYHAWGVFIIQSNPTLLHFTKGFAKGFLEVLCSPGINRKGFSFSNIFFSCSDATLKVCSISVSSSVRFNQYFLKLRLSAGHCAWRCVGTKMNKINVQSEAGSANALTAVALRECA